MYKSKSNDLEVAINLHQQLNPLGVTENAIFPKDKNKENYEPRTLIDQTLETIDPTPNIYTLFVQFNERFFRNVLLPVEVKWSNRMTSCAGVCSFNPRSRSCVISLSAPLLKLRPRKDLVETLLHEMIHGYLFLTNNDRDRDGHGPNFQSHMHRINKEAGTKITIYHDFHDEVKLYQQHWWRCNGPCQHKHPYYGTVRRATNRTPGPNDFWWKEHQKTCGGQFVKVREPEKPKKSNAKAKTNSKVAISNSKDKKQNILSWAGKPLTQIKPSNSTSLLTNTTEKVNINSVSTTKPSTSNSGSFVKLGNSVNNVHGWGTSGPSGSKTSTSTSKIPEIKPASSPKFQCSGTLGGNGTGKSRLLFEFDNCKLRDKKRKSSMDSYLETKHPKLETIDLSVVSCPVCNKRIDEEKLNDHLDICLLSSQNDVKEKKCKIPEDPKLGEEQDCKKGKKCLVCNNVLESSTALADHLEECISMDDMFNEEESSADDLELIEVTKTKKNEFPCPVCMEVISDTEMNKHLDLCLNYKYLKISPL